MNNANAPEMTDRELDEIMIVWWPRVIRQLKTRGDKTWRRGFALSIAGHLKRPEWRPSNKQTRLIRVLLSEFKTQRHRRRV